VQKKQVTQKTTKRKQETKRNKTNKQTRRTKQQPLRGDEESTPELSNLLKEEIERIKRESEEEVEGRMKG